MRRFLPCTGVGNSALGAEGREFESRRPDHLFQPFSGTFHKNTHLNPPGRILPNIACFCRRSPVPLREYFGSPFAVRSGVAMT